MSLPPWPATDEAAGPTDQSGEYRGLAITVRPARRFCSAARDIACRRSTGLRASTSAPTSEGLPIRRTRTRNRPRSAAIPAMPVRPARPISTPLTPPAPHGSLRCPHKRSPRPDRCSHADSADADANEIAVKRSHHRSPTSPPTTKTPAPTPTTPPNNADTPQPSQRAR